MRLLRQISLDGSTWRHSGISNSCATTTTSATNSTSTTSSGKQSTSCSSSSSNTNTPTSSSSSTNSIIINTRSSGSIERLGCNFAAQFFQTITVCNELLHAYDSNDKHSSAITTETNSTTNNTTTDNGKQRKSSKSNANQNIVLRILEQLNGLIVHLIQLTTTTTTAPHQESSTNAVNNNNNNNNSKSSSRLRRQYSALLEGAPFFHRIKRSMSASSGEECSRLSAVVGGSKKSEESEDAFSLTPICGCSLEQAIDRLTESGCLALIVRALPSIGFEEKKLARLILTNSMILKLNGRHPIVHYFCADDSNPITSTDASEDNRLERSPNHHDDNNNVLRLLVQSYSLARSDVTLNCGRILRFASQYRPVVETLIRSPQLFYQFFDYMQSRALPFDVTMDAFYTFKCIMTRHKTITAEMLRADDRSSGAFFDAIVRLLRHAEQQQNYVTKRQTLEIFADIFAGDEWAPLRTQFIESDRRIGPVIENLVNRNVQVRLRCVVLINQLFRVAPEAEQPGDQDATPDRASCSGERNAKIPLQALWRWKLLREKLMQIDLCDSMIEIDDRLRSEWMQNLWRRLRDECAQSNVKQFTSQIPFVDLALQNLI